MTSLWRERLDWHDWHLEALRDALTLARTSPCPCEPCALIRGVARALRGPPP